MESTSVSGIAGKKQGTTYKLNLIYPEVEIKLSTICKVPLKSISLDIATWSKPTPEIKSHSKKLWYNIRQVVKDKLDKDKFSSRYIAINQCAFDMETGAGTYIKYEFTFYNKTQFKKDDEIIESFRPMIEGIYEECFSGNDLYNKRK